MLQPFKRAFDVVALVFGLGAVSTATRNRALRACGGDEETLVRLLDYERSQDPELSDAQAHERVIHSFMRDNR